MACLNHADWLAAPQKKVYLYVSTVFLANRAKVNPARNTLAYSLTLNVLVPDYEIDRRLWINEHYEGSSLFRNQVTVELTPPAAPQSPWKIAYAWQGTAVNLETIDFDTKPLKTGKAEAKIPLPAGGPGTPGIEGQLRFVVSAWNPDTAMAE